MSSDEHNLAPEQGRLQVKVFSRSETFFEGNARTLSARNDTGPFDILPQHHNFITLLQPGTLSIRVDEGEVQEFEIEGGLMRVKSDIITIFLGV